MTTDRGWAAKAVPVLVLAGLCAYANSFTKAFLLDDDKWITQNVKLGTDPVGASLEMGGRRLAMLTVVLNYQFGGLRPAGYHAVNLAVHVAAALALYGLVRRTLLLPRFAHRFDGLAAPVALSAALLWMLHPIQTQSVTYVIQRCESMMGLFFLAAFYAFVRGATAGELGERPGLSRPAVWYALTVVAFALSTQCKETAVVLPPLVALYDRAFVAASWRQLLRGRKWFYLALGAAWAVNLWFTVLSAFFLDPTKGAQDVGFGVATSPYHYLLTQAGVIVHYLKLSVWPTNLCFDYTGWPIATSPADVAAPLAVVLALLAATLWAAVARPAAGFLGLWFFATLAPTSSVMPIIDVAFEQRMYLPLAAVVVWAVVGAAVLYQTLAARAERPRVVALSATILVGLAALVLGVRTAARNEVYRSPTAMWEDVARKNPNGYRSHANLAKAYADTGRYEDAVREADEALRLRPTAAVVQVIRGTALERLGRTDEAGAAFRAASGGLPLADYNAGWAALWARQPAAAEPYFRRAVAANPDRADFHFALAVALYLLKKDADGDAAAAEGRRLAPGWAAARARAVRAMILADGTKPHDLRAAVLQAELIVRMDGGKTPEYLDTLAFGYAAEGRAADATATARRAVQAAAGDAGWLPVLRERLALYEAGKPA